VTNAFTRTGSQVSSSIAALRGCTLASLVCTLVSFAKLSRVSAFLLIALFSLAYSAVSAETISVKSAVVKTNDEALVVDVEFDFTLTAPLEAALVRGTPLYFVFESEVTRARSYWFDETVTTTPSVRRITYVPLTSSYRIDAGGTMGGGASHTSLDEALRQIRVVRGRALVDKRELRSGARYDVSLRLRLDTTQLPKPLQVNTLVSREWTLASEWYRVVVTP
jgi:Domain of unknown function (DUF4390)